MEKEKLLKVLNNNNIGYCELRISKAVQLVAIERGGRIIGIYDEEANQNLLWTAQALEKEKEAVELLGGTVWNTGGDRLWFGPEIRYSVSDRTRFWETLHTPEAIDPGNYQLTKNSEACILHQKIKLCTKDGSNEAVDFHVNRTIMKSENPLRNNINFQELMKEVEFGGFTQRVCLQGKGSSVEGWSLLQVIPRGTIYIPMTQVQKGVNYYEPVGELEHVQQTGIALEATGNRRYKVGYKAERVIGRLGYTCRWNNKNCLLIRNFPNDPAGNYEEEPPFLPGEKGFSVHVYNDDGNSGGFTEIECSLPAVFGKTGRDSSDDTISTWIFTGSELSLKEIGYLLLGCEVNFKY